MNILNFTILFFIFLAPPLYSSSSLDSRLNNIESRLDAIEDHEDSEETNVVTPLNSKRLNIGGYYNIQFHSLSGAKSNSRFRKVEVEFIQRGTFIKDWSFFNELEIEIESKLKDPHLATREFKKHQSIVKLERSWIKYEHSQRLNLTAGYFFSPIGILNQLHYQPVILATDRSLFLRNNSVVRQVAGIKLHGGYDYFKYSLYGGTDILGTRSSFLTGARVGLNNLLSNIFSFGLSYQNSFRSRYGRVDTFALDMTMRLSIFGLTMEFLKDNAYAQGHYIEPFLSFKQFRYYYRYDYADINTKEAKSDDYLRHIAGINYLFRGDKRLKFEYQWYDYKVDFDSNLQKKDYSKFVAELTFTF